MTQLCCVCVGVQEAVRVAGLKHEKDRIERRQKDQEEMHIKECGKGWRLEAHLQFCHAPEGTLMWLRL